MRYVSYVTVESRCNEINIFDFSRRMAINSHIDLVVLLISFLTDYDSTFACSFVCNINEHGLAFLGVSQIKLDAGSLFVTFQKTVNAMIPANASFS